MKRLTLILTLFALALLSVAAVSAQDDASTTDPRPIGPPDRERGALMQALSDITGLTRDDVAEAAQNGQTFAEAIAANGGDVAAVSAELVNAITERVPQADPNEVTARVDQMLNNVPGSNLGERPSGERPRRDRLEQVLLTALDITGLTPEQIRAGAEAGQTFGEIISANGGDVAAVSAELVNAITERAPQADVNEVAARVDQMLSNVPGSNLGERGPRHGGRSGR